MLLSINNKLNITLCGMMGSGKSSIGKIIAKKINFKFLDIDKIIEEKEKKSINDIFNQNGEKYFRIVEEKITYLTYRLRQNRKSVVRVSRLI